VGGGSKKQTVGYRYFLGAHFVLCHGPIDSIDVIRVDDRIAYSGITGPGTININAENLFGGEKREGGISGPVDLEFGYGNQVPNTYLQSQLGNEIPAYRGVVGAVLNQVYVGVNPYLKKWSFEASRLYIQTNGLEQWNSAKVAVSPGFDWDDSAIWIATDVSGSMSGSKISNTRFALNRLISRFEDTEGPLGSDIYLRAWEEVRDRDFEVLDVGGSDYNNMKSEVNSYFANGGTNFFKALQDARGWLNSRPRSRKIVMMITDGGATAGVSTAIAEAGLMNDDGIEVWCFSIQDELTSSLKAIDNTIQDSVPVADKVTDIEAMLYNPFLGQVDMNPAHIIRECLTDNEWGMGYLEEDIDDDVFRAAADIYYDEGMGMSLIWDKETSIENFIKEVLRTCDSSLYVSRQTGKFVLKPIRADYDIGELLTLDESNITSISNPNRVAFGELSNSVTVKYYNRAINRTDSVTVSDTALVQDMRETINAGIAYNGVTRKDLANTLAWRDLRVLSSTLFSCEILCDQTAIDFEIGSVFLFSWTEWNMSNLVMRVTKISFGNGRDNKIRVTCTEDVFATPEQVATAVDDNQWVDPLQPPGTSDNMMADEAPYIELVQLLGQGNTDSSLNANPEAGYIGATAQRAPNAINANLWTDNGSGYDDVDIVDFAPHGFLDSPIDEKSDFLYLNNFTDLDQVEIGSYLQIGESPNTREFCRVDSVDEVVGVIGIGRGCYDLPPRRHFVGANVWFLDLFIGNDSQEYSAGESVDVRITPASTGGVIDLNSVETVTVTLDQRAYRPYAPGDLQINAMSYPFVIPDGELTMSWVGRDRTEQTSGTIFDHFAANIGPEDGVTYRFRGFINDVLDTTVEPATSGETWTPSESGLARVEVDAVRDGVYSYQTSMYEFPYGVDMLATEEPLTRRETEEVGEIRTTED